jgi:hypothetical protein
MHGRLIRVRVKRRRYREKAKLENTIRKQGKRKLKKA